MHELQLSSSSAELPLYRRPSSLLLGAKISSRSYWGDAAWYLDQDSHGVGRKKTINWNISLGNDETLLNEKYSRLLDWLRRFIWSLYTSPGEQSAVLKATTLSSLSTGLSILVPWMVEQRIFWPHQLTAEALESYLEDLPSLLLARPGFQSKDGDISFSSAYHAISIVYKIWQQRKILEQACIKPMPSKPWKEFNGPSSVVTEIAKQRNGWIMPLPDEIAIPLLNIATSLLEGPSNDVIDMRDALDAAYHRGPGDHPNGPGTKTCAKESRQRKVCKNWTFSVLPGQTEPWHLPLADSTIGSAQTALQLVKDIQAAAMLVIQAFTGVRGSELCGILAGINNETNLPRSIACARSASGLNEVFILTTDLVKTEETPRNREWYAGLRPIGSDELPVVVNAILILERLLDPYRKMINSDRLLVSIYSSRGLPKTQDGVERITTARISDMYKSFLGRWIDFSVLPDQSLHPIKINDLVEWKESRGAIITSHQLRKTFAQYVLSVEPSLLPALQRQFKHVSLAMTEGGYWGVNPYQIEALSSVSAQQTALLMFEFATGRSRLAGRASERLKVGAEELRRLIDGLSLESGWRETVKWVRKIDLFTSNSPHGGCLPVAVDEMECWKKASARPIGHRNPNYATREPGLCTGCQCFWMDARHVPFWEQRYIDNELSYQLALKQGNGATFKRIKERAKQARALLTHIGFDMSPADALIKAELVD